MKRCGTLSAIGLMLLLGGCGGYDVHAVVGQEREPFTGKATPTMGGGGHMELSNGKGVDCVGDFTFTSSASGTGLITCNDGQQAMIQFHSLSMTTGYGFGTTTAGRPIRFYVGANPADGAKYIGGPVQTASADAGAGAEPKTRASGTGFFITRQGHVLTNAHVVEGCRSVTVSHNGGAPATASIVGVDKQNDLAVLQAGASPAIAAVRGRPVRPGEPIVVYGFPLAGSLSSGGAVTTGNINALSGLKDDTRYFQISAPVQPGNSGGPLLDNTGAVVGVVTARLASRSGPQNVNFAIKSDVVRTFLGSIDIPLETSSTTRELTTPDIGEKARAFTALIECKG